MPHPNRLEEAPYMSGEFSTNRTDELKGYGFKPGVVLSYSEPGFYVRDVKASLFESRYSTPKTISVKLSEPYRVPVVIDLAKAVERKDEAAEVLPGIAVYYEDPDWYAEGWVQNRSQRVRLYMTTDGPSVDGVYVQVISDEPEDDDLIYHATID
ncbi:hypothetical protein [Streptomyces sp. NPDC046685]|uniref:hypothetical protein n=1 Tax=Streptomyces sp. NPDC046685 TaxID=3157202 RepID=UPI0033D32973